MKKRTLVISALALALVAVPAAALAAGGSLMGWQTPGWSADDPANAAYESDENHVSFYRLYNSYSGEHLFTTDAGERDALAKIGWSVESGGEDDPSSAGLVGMFEDLPENDDYRPIYRLYNPYSPQGEHHYTTSKDEYDQLQTIGWVGEGVFCWSASSQRTPNYRLFNPYATMGTHHYTMSVEERDTLIELGWQWEGVGWYSWGFTA